MWIYTAHGRTFAVLLQSCRSRVAVVAVSLLSRRKSCTWLALANGKVADWLSGNPLSAANYWISGAASRNTITSLSHYVRDVIIIIISSRRQQRCPMRASAPRRLVGSGLKKRDPLRFLAGCRGRQLNQTLSCLSLSLGFFWVCLLCC